MMAVGRRMNDAVLHHMHGGRRAFGEFAVLDADLDGALDLAVVNGHIDDTVRNVNGVGYAQPPQLFLNNGKGMFTDVAAAIGGGFSQPKVGRGLAYADPDLFKMLSFPIIDGNRTAPLHYKNDVVLSKRLALAIFDNENPVGKTLEIQSGNNWRPLHISAVMEDFPDNSSFRYDAVVPF